MLSKTSGFAGCTARRLERRVPPCANGKTRDCLKEGYRDELHHWTWWFARQQPPCPPGFPIWKKQKPLHVYWGGYKRPGVSVLVTLRPTNVWHPLASSGDNRHSRMQDGLTRSCQSKDPSISRDRGHCGCQGSRREAIVHDTCGFLVNQATSGS